MEFFETPQILAGREIDEAFTARIGAKTALPAKFSQWEPMCQVIDEAPGQKFTQMQLALDQSFALSGYRDWNKTYVRVIYDFAQINGNRALLVDWKNGKVSVSHGQLCLFAATCFHHFPEVEVVDTSYAWLAHGFTSDATYHRRELPDMWQTFIPTVERMQVAHKANNWPATPKPMGKGFACGWCGANKTGKCKEARGEYKGS